MPTARLTLPSTSTADLADGERNVGAADRRQRAHEAGRDRLGPGGQGLREADTGAAEGGGAQEFATPSESELNQS